MITTTTTTIIIYIIFIFRIIIIIIITITIIFGRPFESLCIPQLVPKYLRKKGPFQNNKQ